jgi:hypothetical protein
MKDAFVTWLKANAGKHTEAIVVAVVLFLGARLWLQEHDARLAADATVKTAQTAIADLQKQQAAVAQVAKVQIVQLQSAAAAVRTTPEAITDMPTVTPTATQSNPAPELDAEALPDAPNKVSVDAVPLYLDLNACKQDSVNLAACSKELSIQKDITTQKDVEIVALKKKPAFWHRVKETAITLGVGAGIGAIGYAVATR